MWIGRVEVVGLPGSEDPTLPEGLNEVMVRTGIAVYRVVIVLGSCKGHGGRRDQAQESLRNDAREWKEGRRRGCFRSVIRRSEAARRVSWRDLAKANALIIPFSYLWLGRVGTGTAHGWLTRTGQEKTAASVR